MRKIIVLEFMTLDNVMQAPGGPQEDTSGGFKYGGWTAPYFDEFTGNIMSKQMSLANASLLLGRKTYDIFAEYWPHHAEDWPGINEAEKYVVSHDPALHLTWENSHLVTGDIAEEIKKIKHTDGPDLQVWGSGDLVQTLLRHDLIDELKLKIFPVTLGAGKKLFGDGTTPLSFKLSGVEVSPSGVIIADYVRSGEVTTGSVA